MRNGPAAGAAVSGPLLTGSELAPESHDGWEMMLSFWDFRLFSAGYVNFRECISLLVSSRYFLISFWGILWVFVIIQVSYRVSCWFHPGIFCFNINKIYLDILVSLYVVHFHTYPSKGLS